MTVRQLREALKNFEDNRIVIVSCDAEGNEYSTLSAIDASCYWNEHHREIRVPPDAEKSDKPAIVLYRS